MLPIDPHLDDIASALRQHRSAVIEAPPGAGKTTRVPLALLDSEDREIWVLEPRRLAAQLPARFVSRQLGEPVGERVGYHVRYDEAAGPRTRLRYMTTALLLRRLVDDPQLERAGTLVFDEFHERALAADVGVAITRRLRATTRPDLGLAVMSATLDGAACAKDLGAPLIRSAGRCFPVDIAFAQERDARPLETRVAIALAELLRGGLAGDVLVFLPGAAEIRRVAAACAPWARQADLVLLPLHGSLSASDQEKALAPAERRKVILATNVAETSITIPGVTVVIDSGLARVPEDNRWTGVQRLAVRTISQASATQRAGRAGRTAPGRCLRLYTRREFASWPEVAVPEIQRLELAETLLLLRGLGLDARELPWLTAPPKGALESAERVLHDLGALSGHALSPTGRAMLRMPLHPRHARTLLEAMNHGAGAAGCAMVACLAEDSVRTYGQQPDVSGASDVLLELELIQEAERRGFAESACNQLGIRANAARAVARARDQLRARLKPTRDTHADPELALRRALLAGHPDRVAQRCSGAGERKGRQELLLCGGGRALLAAESVVRGADYVVVLEAEQRGRSMLTARQVSAVEPEWLLELGAIAESETLQWNATLGRVDAVRELRYGALVLDEARAAAPPSRAASDLLAQHLAPLIEAALSGDGAVARLALRVATLQRLAPELELPAIDAGALCATLGADAVSCASITDAVLAATLAARVGPETMRLLERWLPESLRLANGRRLAIHYERGRDPWAQSMLQDFLGMRSVPKLAEGRLPLTLHLLAPNRRPVQVTTDLESFWRTHYPALRRSLARRYPRHAWPEDPWRTA